MSFTKGYDRFIIILESCWVRSIYLTTRLPGQAYGVEYIYIYIYDESADNEFCVCLLYV